MNHSEKLALREKNLERQRKSLEGSGRYVYQNNSDSMLSLPKPAYNDVKFVKGRGEFEGDSYFKRFVGPPSGMLKLMQIIEEETKKETILTEGINVTEKLILDQAPTITNEGTVEIVTQKLNESAPKDSKKVVLLNETPLDGIEIIKD